MVWCCISGYGIGSLHIWKSTFNAEEYIETLEQHLLSSKQSHFPESLAYFSSKKLNQILPPKGRVWVLN